MHNFKDLRVWQKSIELTTEIYALLSTFSPEEKFGAAISIPSNIAEDAGRNSNKEFKHFLSISLGSLSEIETQLIIANRLRLINTEVTHEVNVNISDVQRMIFALEKNMS